jgi:hypothetical protein
MNRKHTRRELTLEEKISVVKGSTQLEGFTLSDKAIERCRRVLEGRLSAEEAIQEIIEEKSHEE